MSLTVPAVLKAIILITPGWSLQGAFSGPHSRRSQSSCPGWSTDRAAHARRVPAQALPDWAVHCPWTLWKQVRVFEQRQEGGLSSGCEPGQGRGTHPQTEVSLHSPEAACDGSGITTLEATHMPPRVDRISENQLIPGATQPLSWPLSSFEQDDQRGLLSTANIRGFLL